MKFNEAFMMIVKKDLENGLIPMLLGEPGIGKSSWVEALAELMRTKCFTLACNQLADKADLTGARLVPIYADKTDEDGNVTREIADYKQMFYPHAVISDAIAYAEEHPRETPILFLDELNRTTPDVTSEALSIPTMRSIGSKSLPNNLKVMIAGNDKGNVTSLDEASVSRFVLYRVTPDVNTFLNLDTTLNIFIKNVLQAHPECLFCKKSTMVVAKNEDDEENDELSIDDILEDADDMAQISTPRTIMGLSRWLNSFSNQELMTMLADISIVDGVEVSFLQEAIEGHVGKTNFSSLLMAEIANNIMTANNQSTGVTVPKPNCYDELKSQPDMTALNEFVANLDDNDKSGCILYALYEQVDNSVILRALAGTINKLMPNDIKTLVKLSALDKLDEGNKQALMKTATNVANSLALVLE